MKRISKKWVWLLPAALALASIILFTLFYTGMLLVVNPSGSEYPVRGVDVSSYQGTIDWAVLADQDIDFAFIKATEGSDFTDPCFNDNLSGASETSLVIGAYHFFSFESSGKTQAENFIGAVPNRENMLPPVVDVELYGDFQSSPPDREAVQAELNVMLQMLESHYGIKPLLYVTEKSYALYIDGEYEAYDIWMRGIFRKPADIEGRRIRFWQYTSRRRLEGYTGREPYIDMNVFCGSEEAFRDYIGGSSSAYR